LANHRRQSATALARFHYEDASWRCSVPVSRLCNAWARVRDPRRFHHRRGMTQFNETTSSHRSGDSGMSHLTSCGSVSRRFPVIRNRCIGQQLGSSVPRTPWYGASSPGHLLWLPCMHLSEFRPEVPGIGWMAAQFQWDQVWSSHSPPGWYRRSHIP